MEDVSKNGSQKSLTEVVEKIIDRGSMTADDQRHINMLGLSGTTHTTEESKALELLTKKIESGDIQVV